MHSLVRRAGLPSSFAQPVWAPPAFDGARGLADRCCCRRHVRPNRHRHAPTPHAQFPTQFTAMLAAVHHTPATSLPLAQAFAAGHGTVSVGRVEDNTLSAIVLNNAAQEQQQLPDKLVNMVSTRIGCCCVAHVQTIWPSPLLHSICRLLPSCLKPPRQPPTGVAPARAPCGVSWPAGAD